MTLRSTKTYGHEQGLSVCFRQWRANESHCHLLHGYALAFRFVFAAHKPDARNWIQDFGALKPLKAKLQEMFDHKLLVAEDDPYKDELCALAGLGVADVLVLPKIGIEACAELAWTLAHRVLQDQALPPGMWSKPWVESCECFEHPGNSAIYTVGQE